MPVICPNCGHENPDGSGFCVRCGNGFQTTGQMNPPYNSFPTYTPVASSSLPAQSYAPVPPAVSQYPPASQSWGTPASPSPAQMGTGQGLASIRRAFAGRGTLIMHHSWLLDGKQMQAVSVLTAIRDMLAQRNYAGLSVNPERLMERGVIMEQRDYLAVNRNGSTVFVYVAPTGNDLYISRATTVLPPISNVRVAIFGLLVIIMFIGFFTRPSPYSLMYGDYFGFVVSTVFSILSVPLLLFFIVFVTRSFIHWLFEKDFWVYLRPNLLNAFQLDDIALLEHSTDRIVRETVQQLGLDASKIVPPAQGYQPKRKMRII